MTAGRFCDRCNQIILGDAEEIPRHSSSGARPNSVVHAWGCPPPPTQKERRNGVAR